MFAKIKFYNKYRKLYNTDVITYKFMVTKTVVIIKPVIIIKTLIIIY